MVQETSLLAYEEIKSSLGDRQKQVYYCLKKLHSATNFMIARKLQLQINCVTPRVKELRDKKLVGVSFIENDLFTGRRAIYWKVLK